MNNIESIGSIQKGIELGKNFNEYLPISDDLETNAEASFTWNIEGWNTLKDLKYCSPKFNFAGYDWDLLIFPTGNHSRGLSIYLAPHPSTVSQLESKNDDWYVCAQFAIVFSKPGDDRKVQLANKASHRFTSTEKDWGFSSFIELEYLKHFSRSRPSGFLNQGKLNITAFIRTVKDPTGVLWHNFLNYDSKKMTGFVGFKNQGATCYLNSLLQSYYFTKMFRKLVYQIPTDSENPTDSVALALQRAFYSLQTSEEQLDTLELTKSFGWDTGDAFTQHDVQELNRILMDRLEQRMKGTAVEGKLSELFVGRMKSYIKCIDIDFESSRVEDFWDIQLNVKNTKNLSQSFEQYIEVEILNGENQYAAQGHGLQDAKKGVLFESFPPVLHLQLKRFEYDFNYDQLIKINDRFEFPDVIDLSPYLDPSILPKPPAEYYLHGVLVHTGDISTGHYYAMIKPSQDDSWYRFDDDRVLKVTRKQVFDENFGCHRLKDEELRLLSKDQYQSYLISRQTSAYMLVYMRKDMEQTILEEVKENDVPSHVIKSIREELENKKKRRKELEDMHLYATVRLHSLRNFIHYSGQGISPDKGSALFSPELHDENEYALENQVLKSTKLKDILVNFNENLGLKPKSGFRYWYMGYRLNETLRLDEPLNDSNLEMALDEFMKSKGRISSCDFFLEEAYFELNHVFQVQKNSSLSPGEIGFDILHSLEEGVYDGIIPTAPLKPLDSSSVLLLLKHFNPDEQRLSGLLFVVVNIWETVQSLCDKISALSEKLKPVEIYEEAAPDELRLLDRADQFIKCELQDGDILVFSTSASMTPECLHYYADVPSYYSYLQDRVKLVFSRCMDPEEDYVVTEEGELDPFSFWLSARSSYYDLARAVSKHANVKPELLRLYAVYPSRKFVMNSQSVLTDYLVKNFTRETIPQFEYEVLSIKLDELEHLRSIKLFWLSDSYIHYQCFEFRVPNSSTVGDFIEKLQTRVGFTDEDKENVLLWTNCSYEFEGILTANMIFDSMKSSLVVFGRILPEEVEVIKQIEIDSGYDDESEEDLTTMEAKSKGKILIVNQYFRDLENAHGIAFLFPLLPDEKFPETRERLHAKFGLGAKEFSKVKLGAYYQTDKGIKFFSLEGNDIDDLILYDKLGNLDHLCMDHPDRSKTQAGYTDKPMVIKS